MSVEIQSRVVNPGATVAVTRRGQAGAHSAGHETRVTAVQPVDAEQPKIDRTFRPNTVPPEKRVPPPATARIEANALAGYAALAPANLARVEAHLKESVQQSVQAELARQLPAIVQIAVKETKRELRSTVATEPPAPPAPPEPKEAE